MASFLLTDAEGDNIPLARADGGTLVVFPTAGGAGPTIPQGVAIVTVANNPYTIGPTDRWIVFDNSAGLTTQASLRALLPAPVPGTPRALGFKWAGTVVGAAPPTVDGNGHNVEQLATPSGLSTLGATSSFGVVGQAATYVDDGNEWLLFTQGP